MRTDKDEDDEFTQALIDSLEAEHAFLVDRFNKAPPGKKWAPADFVYDPLRDR